MVNIPSQKKTLAEKGKDDWGKRSMDSYIDLSIFARQRKNDMYLYYELYNGKLIESDYTHILDPYNSRSTGNPMPLPIKPKNFPIIMPLVDMVCGEKRKRPLNTYVKVTNPDVIDRMDEEKRKKLMPMFKQMYINAVNQAKETGLESKQVPNIEEVEANFMAGYKDKRAVAAQHLMSAIIDEEHVYDKFHEPGFKDYMIGGEVCSFKGVFFNNPTYEIVNPLFLDFIMTPETRFGENADAVVRRKYMYVSEVWDTFRDILEEENIDITELEKHARGVVPDQITVYQSPQYYYTRTERLIEVIHVVWKSFKKVGMLEYIDEYGLEQQMDVDETYSLDKEHGDIKIKWGWISEVWEGYRINKQHYVAVRPYLVQRRSLDNPSECVLPYNRICFSNRNADNTSPVKILAPYQFYYNIYRMRLDMLVAASKGKIALIDITAIPDKWGPNALDKFFYYSDVMKMGFIDPTQNGSGNRPSGFGQWGSVLDLELKESIQMVMNVLERLKLEAEDVLGITRQRKGQVSSSERVGNVQEAVSNSYTISEPLFARFEEFQERELQGLLDLAKIAYRNGKKGLHITSDEDNLIFDIDGLEFGETNFLLTATNATKDIQRLEALRSVATQLASNTKSPSSIAEIFASDSFVQIKKAMQAADQAMQKYEMSMQQGQQQAAADLEEKRIAWEKEQIAREEVQQQLTRESNERIAALRAAGQEEETTIDQVDLVGLTKVGNDRFKEEQKHTIDREKLSIEKNKIKTDEKLKNRELDVKEKEIETNLKIAKENKGKYDK